MIFSINGKKYEISKLNAMKQFHIARRLGSLFSSNGSESPNSFLKALSEMKDEQAESLVFGLLECVSREIEGGLGFSPVVSGGNIMFSDLSLSDLITLAAKSFEVNLSPFFKDAPAVLSNILGKKTED